MQIHSTLSSPALTNTQVGRQKALRSLEITMPVPVLNSSGLSQSFRKKKIFVYWYLSICVCIPAFQCLHVRVSQLTTQEQSAHRYEHDARETYMFAGKSVWYVFHNPYLCVGCCGMHKILLSQQHEVVEELAQEGVGEKAMGRTIFGQLTAVCTYVRVGV